MKSVRNESYKLKKVDINKLKDMGFHISYKYSSDGEIYIYDFPVYKYNNKTILYGRIIINIDTKSIICDCFDSDGSLYPAFYQNDLERNNVAAIANKKILAKYKQLGAKKKR